MATPLQVPYEPLLVELFYRWRERPESTLIWDLSANKVATIGDFLYDVLTLRERLHDSLDDEARKQLRDPDTDVFVAIFGGQGYGFAGFYKTGDTGRLDGNFLTVLGRASHDVIRFRAWKMHAPEIENTISEHPHVSQAVVVGVPDPSAGQRVAALLVPKDTAATIPGLDPRTLRKWLAVDKRLSVYKLPTLLRVVGPGDSLPCTASGKPVKPAVRVAFFSEVEVLSGHVEVWDLDVRDEDVGEKRPFDWAGIQGSWSSPSGLS